MISYYYIFRITDFIIIICYILGKAAHTNSCSMMYSGRSVLTEFRAMAARS